MSLPNTIEKTAELLKQKEISPVELTKLFLDKIDSNDEKYNSYITVLHEKALETATKAENEITSGIYKGPLHGVPISIKDIFVMKDVRSTCGSKMLEKFISPYNATVTAKLVESGAIILGKNNMDEFAMGSSNETSYFGTVKNPWDLERVPGGSSGGSAVSTAANLCLASVGTDTGGSIRQPGSLCGVVGMKPTYGRVSRFGMIAFASSLDQAGPITKTVYDTALILNVISGHDTNDSTSIDAPVPDFTKNLNGDIKGLRVGVPKEYSIEGMDPEVKEKIDIAISELEKLGAKIIEISLPHTSYAVSTYY
ncbi:MAG: Asp-tRNA(Asn)/Glu-tRNA(Gln) amidotransferase subunit GatA, partial [Candidatus Dadabacteria bacterium]|nr:Asp-tRNA(Asn)/Glu-tRNA(Gln) amidotransferase subunit GatA [Candidatus Dadabacteria bacterium]NIQ14595.1 Asp-tRNA(Asn)/Glu-tRNA(Gln) amidotransferase subunit GatA [Candidatus Dadabacteria bacterium]